MDKEELVGLVQEVLNELQTAGEPKEPEGEPKEPEGEPKEPEGEPKEPKGEPKEPEGEPKEPKEPEGEPKEPEGEPKEPKNLEVDLIVDKVLGKLKESDPNTQATADGFVETLNKIGDSMQSSGEFTEEEKALLDFVLLNYDSLNERVDQLLS